MRHLRSTATAAAVGLIVCIVATSANAEGLKFWEVRNGQPMRPFGAVRKSLDALPDLPKMPGLTVPKAFRKTLDTSTSASKRR
ncbi:MAG: hypothetical protein QM775_22860 [Pirellulales bacterium]